MEKTLNVSVNIIAQQTGGQLEIETTKSHFLAQYIVQEQRFSPLEIPFTVRSISGSNVNYSLAIDSIAGRCAGNDISLTSTLDGAAIAIHDKRPYTGTDVPHSLVVDFPVLPQLTQTFFCEGHVSIVAELII